MMKIEFIGPHKLAEDGGIVYAAQLDGQALACHFSYEALQDLDPDARFELTTNGLKEVVALQKYI